MSPCAGLPTIHTQQDVALAKVIELPQHPPANEGVETGCIPSTLREGGTQLLDHGRVPIFKIVDEIVLTCPELDRAIGGKADLAGQAASHLASCLPCY